MADVATKPERLAEHQKAAEWRRFEAAQAPELGRQWWHHRPRYAKISLAAPDPFVGLQMRRMRQHAIPALPNPIMPAAMDGRSGLIPLLPCVLVPPKHTVIVLCPACLPACQPACLPAR